jgi:hypothetical protein
MINVEREIMIHQQSTGLEPPKEAPLGRLAPTETRSLLTVFEGLRRAAAGRSCRDQERGGSQALSRSPLLTLFPGGRYTRRLKGPGVNVR